MAIPTGYRHELEEPAQVHGLGRQHWEVEVLDEVDVQANVADDVLSRVLSIAVGLRDHVVTRKLGQEH